MILSVKIVAGRINQRAIAHNVKSIKFVVAYSEYETGKIELDYEKIVFLCNRLDITPNDLFEIK